MILKPKSSNTKATSYSKATTTSTTKRNNSNNDVTSRATTAALHKAKQIMLAGGTQEEAAIAAKNVARLILMEESMNTNTSSRGGSSAGSGSGSGCGGDNSKGYSKSSTSRSYNNSNGRVGQRSALTLSSNAASNATVSRLAMKNNTTKSASGRGSSKGGGKGKGGLLSKFRNKRKNKKKSKGDEGQLPGIAEVSVGSDEGRDELSSSKNDYNNNNMNGRDEREESSPDTTTASPEPDQQQEDTVFKQFSNAADTVVELVEKLSGEAPVVNNGGGGENSSDFSSYDSSQDYYTPVENKNEDKDDDKNTEKGNVEGRMEDLVNLNFVMNAVEKEIFPVAAQEKKSSKQHQKTFSSDDSKELRASNRREDGSGGFLSKLCGALFSVEDGICSLGRGESQSFCSNTQSASYDQQHQKTNKTSVPSTSLPSVSLDNSSRRHNMDIANDMDMGVEMSASNNHHHHKSISWADSHNNQRDDRYGLNIDNTNSTNDSSLIKAMARGMVNGSRSFVQSTRPPQAIETTFDGSTFETKDTYGTNKTSKGNSKSGVGSKVVETGGVDLVSKNSGKGGAESVSSKVKTILMNKNPFKSSNQCLGGGGYQCGTSGYYVPPGGEEAGVEVFEGGENVDSNVNWRDMVQDTAPRDLDRGRSMSQQASGQYQASSGYQASPPSQFQHPTPQEAREYIQMHSPQVSNLQIASQQQVVASQLPIVNREPSHIPKVNSNFSVESDDDRQDRYAGMPEEETEQQHPQHKPKPSQHNMVQMQDEHVMRSDMAYGDNRNTMAGQQRVEVVNNSPPVAPPTVTELVMSNTSLFSGLLGDSETGSVEQHVDGNGNGGQQGYRMQPVRMHMPTSNKVPFNARQQYSEIMQIPPFNPNKQRMMSNSNNHQPPQYQQQEYHPLQQVGMTTRDTQSQINVMGPPSDYHVQQQQQQYYQSQYQQPPFNHGVDPNSGVYYEERNPQPTSPHAYHGGYRTFAA